jgi:hypothetical protein
MVCSNEVGYRMPIKHGFFYILNENGNIFYTSSKQMTASLKIMYQSINLDKSDGMKVPK